MAVVALLLTVLLAAGNDHPPRREFGKEFEVKRSEIKELRERTGSAVPTLIAILLENPDWQRRMLAAQALGEMPASDEVRRAFMRAAFDPDPYVRRDAVCGLRCEPVSSKEVEATLIKVLETDRVGFIRLQAALSLGALRPVMSSAVEALARAVLGTSVEGRIGAANALAGIGPEAKSALPVLVRALDVSDDRPDVLEVVDAIDRIGETPREAVPLIFRAVRGSHSGDYETPARAIAHAGTAALPDLIAASRDDDRVVRIVAALVLKDVKHPPELDPAIAAALREYEDELEQDRITPDENN